MNKKAQDRIAKEKKEKSGELSLISCNLDKMPKELLEMTWISTLDISYNNISYLENLPESLTTLDIHSNEISQLENLPESLTTLDIHSNQISQLENLPESLITLNISFNEISHLENLPKSLTALEISGNQITKLKNLPEALMTLEISDNEIWQLENLPAALITLNIRNNQITKLENLSETLTTLYISDNKISQLENLPGALTTLIIISNQISQLENLPESLTTLYISDNKISQLENLPESLTTLYIWNNEIRQLENLPESLTTLYISGNQISQLENLPGALITLNIISNQISQLENLPESLMTLEISSNKICQLENLPEVLRALRIDSNQISQLENLPESLTTLYISNNKIKDLKPILFLIKKDIPVKWDNEYGKEICVGNNPLIHPPEVTVKQGNQAILRYFEELDRAGEAKLLEAKLLIVGQGGSGKTSLKKKLQDVKAAMPKSEDTTRGIEIETHYCKTVDGEDFKLHIWDFGGQNIQHYAHQFFLTDSALYALLTNERKQDNHLHYWLNIIKMLGKNSPVLLVQNEMEGHAEPLKNAAAIRKHFENVISPFHSVNIKKAETDERFDTLRKAIVHYATGLPHVGKIFPTSFVNVKNKLSELADNEHFVNWTKFKTLCKAEGVEKPELMADFARTYTILGSSLRFEDDIELRNIVFLRPKWIIDALFTLLYHPIILEQKGTFSEDDTLKIWPEDIYDEMRGKLIRLMENFELCYRIKDSKKYIVPQRLPPAEDYAWEEKETSKVIYDYNFMPSGIITRLICRLHDLIDKKSAWSDAFVLHTEQAKAFVQEVYSEEKILIEVTGKKGHELLNQIIAALDSIHQDSKYGNLKVGKMVACPCPSCAKEEENLFYFEYDLLMALIDDGEKQERCSHSRKMINIQDILRHSGIQKTVETATTATEIKKLLRNNEIKKVLENMLKSAETEELKDEVVMLWNRFSRNEGEKDRTSFDNYQMTYNKVVKDITELIREIFE